jgi:hypothetical protein
MPEAQHCRKFLRHVGATGKIEHQGRILPPRQRFLTLIESPSDFHTNHIEMRR